MDFEQVINKIKKRIISGELEEKLKYYFKNKVILLRALTHKSYIFYFKESYINSNERLELLGDSVLSLLIIELLLEKFPEEAEGFISKLKAKIVSEHALERIARKIHLENYLLLGRGEYNLKQHDKPSILADAVESIIGAIYIDGGLENARNFIKNHFEEIINLCCERKEFLDYKTKLQEYSQKRFKNKPFYKLLREEGPEHNKVFHVEVFLNKRSFGTGSGKNKKEAEQNAAKEALKKIDNSNFPQS